MAQTSPTRRTQTELVDPVVKPSRWVSVCALSEIIPGTGAAALINGLQIAIVRPRKSDEVFALSNFDPFSKAFVIARGIVGDRQGTLKIASPIFKQSFDLRTGQCLDDEAVRLPVYPARVVGGQVEIQMPVETGS